jgi:DNA helicase II / ATP-dependent DNA helicase PcrA
MTVNLLEFENPEAEANFIVDSVKWHLENDPKNAEIAIIARDHKTLKILAFQLNKNNIAVEYEKNENVLEQLHIVWITDILKFIYYHNRNDFENADSFIPKILAQPVFQIDPIVVYDIALQ